ncbi:MAG: hypothetical protein LRY66_05235 [Saccharospirillaceae bacterium]|nr:hypothetical protein [Saccharospirillaceae bacterium]MCD8530760.1 hypothetical protein [Saccharospirillaceae bacterium]
MEWYDWCLYNDVMAKFGAVVTVAYRPRQSRSDCAIVVAAATMLSLPSRSPSSW